MQPNFLFARKNFNSRPHGGRLYAMWTSWKYKNFNSRPHGGRQARPIFFDASRDFNSRPHGGRLSCHAIDIVTVNISTHALTEGDALLTAV